MDTIQEQEKEIPPEWMTTDGKDFREEWKNNPDMIKTSKMPPPNPGDTAAAKFNRWLEEQRK